MKLIPKIVAAAAALALTGGALTACGSSDAQSDGAESEGPSRVVLTSHAAANTLDELDLEDNVIGLTKTGVFPDALCYAFYPVHMLVIVMVLNFVNR